MRHTLGTAAKACGVGRSTILRAINSGRISASKDDTGSYAIDPAELHRVFPPVSTEQKANQTMERDATAHEMGGTAALTVKIEGLEALLSRERETVDDLRRRLDLSEAERRETQGKLTALLTYQAEQKPSHPEPASKIESEKGRLWEKLFGRGYRFQN